MTVTCAARGCYAHFEPYRSTNRFCSMRCRAREKARRDRMQHTQRHRDEQRRARLKREYGLTVEQYDAMLENQGGVCAICGRPPSKNRLAVDHDHVTGRVRGLLCMPCNRHVGWFEVVRNGFLLYALKYSVTRNRDVVSDLTEAVREQQRTRPDFASPLRPSLARSPE